MKAYDGLVDGFLAGSLGGMCWVTEKYPEKKLSLQHSVYTFNRETRQLYQDCFAPDSYTAPLELNRRELEALPPQNQEMVVYGRVPMMVSASKEAWGPVRFPIRKSSCRRESLQQRFPVG